jgi:hypothetical protein
MISGQHAGQPKGVVGLRREIRWMKDRLDGEHEQLLSLKTGLENRVHLKPLVHLARCPLACDAIPVPTPASTEWASSKWDDTHMEARDCMEAGEGKAFDASSRWVNSAQAVSVSAH